jgi:dephospho-CoA kinase
LIGEQIRDEISRLREASLTPAVALDAPVLIKAGWDRLCDELVFVSADAEARRRRALARGWTEEEWRRREEAQTPLTRMRAASSEVVENSGDAAAAERQVMALWQKWGFSFPATESLASAR